MVRIQVICGGCGIEYRDEHGNLRHMLKTSEAWYPLGLRYMLVGNGYPRRRAWLPVGFLPFLRPFRNWRKKERNLQNCLATDRKRRKSCRRE